MADVPDDLFNAAFRAWRRSDELDTEGRLEDALAAVLPEHERQVRARIATEMPKTCESCAHLTDFHHEDGCWFTVASGKSAYDLVCPCDVPLAALKATTEETNDG